MGHTRLGEIPKTRRWEAVVGIVGGEIVDDVKLSPEDVKNIAQETLNAAQEGLKKASNDLGVRFTFYLLTKIIQFSKEQKWQNKFAEFGINLPENATVFDLTTQLQSSIDNFLYEHDGPSDLSEIAQQSAGEAIVRLVGPHSISLFGEGRNELLVALRRLSTKKNYSKFGQIFFGNFVTRFLNFYLSRITASSTGTHRLRQIGDLANFNKILQIHCEQSAWVVHNFCGEWYSKTNYLSEINLANSSAFIAVAFKKLKKELLSQRDE